MMMWTGPYCTFYYVVYGDIHGLDYGMAEMSNQCTPKDYVWLTNSQSRIILIRAFNSPMFGMLSHLNRATVRYFYC